MTFDTEPAWMQAARRAPLRSTWESRQPPEPRAPQRAPKTTTTSKAVNA